MKNANSSRKAVNVLKKVLKRIDEALLNETPIITSDMINKSKGDRKKYQAGGIETLIVSYFDYICKQMVADQTFIKKALLNPVLEILCYDYEGHNIDSQCTSSGGWIDNEQDTVIHENGHNILVKTHTYAGEDYSDLSSDGVGVQAIYNEATIKEISLQAACLNGEIIEFLRKLQIVPDKYLSIAAAKFLQLLDEKSPKLVKVNYKLNEEERENLFDLYESLGVLNTF